MGIYNSRGEPIYSAYSSNGDPASTTCNKYGLVNYPYDLCVMSFNPQWFTGINAQEKMLMDIFFKNNADLVGLQEVSKTGTIPDVGNNIMRVLYPYSAISDHYNYLALKSKYALSDITMADYVSQDPNMNETRGYLKAYVTVRGKQICFITTHLELDETYRNAQMAELFAIAQNETYVIMTGDFNTVSDKLDSDDYRNMYKQYVDAGYHLANCSERNGFVKTFSSGTDHTTLDQFRSACDNVIVSGNIDIISREVDVTKLKYLNGDRIDHCPIVARLRINDVEEEQA